MIGVPVVWRIDYTDLCIRYKKGQDGYPMLTIVPICFHPSFQADDPYYKGWKDMLVLVYVFGMGVLNNGACSQDLSQK